MSKVCGQCGDDSARAGYCPVCAEHEGCGKTKLVSRTIWESPEHRRFISLSLWKKKYPLRICRRL